MGTAKRNGRPPQPTALRELHGNPGKRPLKVDEPEGRGMLWQPPAWFDEEQRAQWFYALDHAPVGLLTATDREVLVVWCVACIEHARAAQEVRKRGQVVLTKDGNAIQNPFLPIVNRQATLMMRSGYELGFSPAARTAMGRELGGAGEVIEGRRASDLDSYMAEKPDRLDS
jgi:P27 family predicted phage terminase small subunit